MFPVWLTWASAFAASVAPAPDGRALYTVLDPTFEGNGLGGGLFADGSGLGDVASSLRATAVVGWTLRPLRLAVVLPTTVGADQILGLPPRLDLRFVLSDRKRGGLGVAAALDAPMPFVLGSDRPSHLRIALGVGKKDTVVTLNLGAPIGPPFEAFTWSIGGALPLTGPLGAFGEIDGVAPMSFGPDLPSIGWPGVSGARLGLHLAPIRPLVLTLALGGSAPSPFPTLSVGAGWMPPPRNRPPRTDGPDRDHDRVADSVDACPNEREDFDDGNDADGCPDGGARTSAIPDDRR